MSYQEPYCDRYFKGVVFLFVLALLLLVGKYLLAQQVDYKTQVKNKPLSELTIAFKSPALADNGKVQLKFAENRTLVRVSCSTDEGTVDVNFDIRTEAAPNVAGTNVLSADLQCADPTAVMTSFAQAALLAHQVLNLQVNAKSGTPGAVRITIEHKLTP